MGRVKRAVFKVILICDITDQCWFKLGWHLSTCLLLLVDYWLIVRDMMSVGESYGRRELFTVK